MTRRSWLAKVGSHPLGVSGELRTLPLVFVRTQVGFIVANAGPAGGRSNPWVLNLHAAGEGTVRVGGRSVHVRARELEGPELGRVWPGLVAVWPSFDEHYAATGERSVFELRPVEGEP